LKAFSLASFFERMKLYRNKDDDPISNLSLCLDERKEISPPWKLNGYCMTQDVETVMLAIRTKFIRTKTELQLI
jgi:hypothetical protein